MCIFDNLFIFNKIFARNREGDYYIECKRNYIILCLRNNRKIFYYIYIFVYM